MHVNYKCVVSDMKKTVLFDSIEDRTPVHLQVNDLDLVLVKYDSAVSVLYGRCLHRGALMSDGYIDGDNLICGVHGWDYRYDTGVSEYNNKEVLHKFRTEIRDGYVWVSLLPFLMISFYTIPSLYNSFKI